MGKFSVVVLDFETTGLSPDGGDRAIEIGAVLIRDNRIVDRFESLMNPGMKVSSFIEEYTGISNRMLAAAPSIAEVMPRFYRFIDGLPLVAHNASFDRRFLDAEMRRLNLERTRDFACSMRLSHRLYPEAPGHSLEKLVRYKKLQTDGVHHRALADAEMTGHLWLSMVADLKTAYGFRQVPFELMRELATVRKSKAAAFLAKAARLQG